MSRFYRGGGGYNTPEAIERLPLALLRNPYPRRPEETAHAAEAYLANQPQPVMYLPQRMGFTKWKTPPMQVAWGSNVVALMDALEQGVHQVRDLYSAAMGPTPTASIRQEVVARSLNPLPQAVAQLEPYMDVQPPTSEALPDYRFTSAQELSSYVQQVRQTARNQADTRDARRAEALISVTRQREQLQSLFLTVPGLE